MEEIASADLLCVSAAGAQFPVTVSVARPTRQEDGLWSCAVRLDGLYSHLSPMKSDESLHALCLGLFLIRNLLLGFIADGGKILLPGAEQEEFPLDAYFPKVPTEELL